MGGNNNELYGVVCGGQGRSGTDMLWSACIAYGAAALGAALVGLLIAGANPTRSTGLAGAGARASILNSSPPSGVPVDDGGGSVFHETSDEAVPAPHVYPDARNGAGASLME